MSFYDLSKKLLLYTLLIIVAISTFYPFVWMVLTSFKPEPEVVTYPPRLLPKSFTLAAYHSIWRAIPFLRFFINTIIFAGTVTVISLFLDSLAAYAFARIPFPGRNVLFILVLSTLMIPFQVTMIPVFVILFKLKWLDTFAALIVPRATNAFGIFLLRQFFMTIPKELEEAAIIDGCSESRIYWNIIMPLSLPALTTLAIFHFMYNWNDFLWPLIVTSSTEMRTLPVGLALFMGQHVIEYAILMAGSTLSLLPIIVAYIFAQRYFVQGIALTGLKS
ncbi:MAG: carbohydrate ABC transporter permease [Firmicutes bacterium]|nr:carbohydrate ABC transporter permease [Bacillota bacterium]